MPSYQGKAYRLLDNLVVECWIRVREVPSSIPSQGPRHTQRRYKNGTSSSLVWHSTFKWGKYWLFLKNLAVVAGIKKQRMTTQNPQKVER